MVDSFKPAQPVAQDFAAEFEVMTVRERGWDESRIPAVFGPNRHSTLMFASLITFAHLRVSASWHAANCSGELHTAMMPESSRRFLTSGVCRALTTSAWILDTISFGVPAGT